MRPYIAIINARFCTLLQYRAAAFAGFMTQLFWGLLRVMIFTAFYASSAAHQPMTRAQMITYVWLGQAMLAMLPWNIDGDVREMVNSGSVAYELLKPVDLYSLWFCRALAWRSAPTFLRAIPMFLVAGAFLGLKAPPSWACAGVCAVSMLAALLLSCAITTLLHITILWTISGEGIARLLTITVMAFSGLLVPLPFFPEWSQRMLDFLPFRGIADVPYRLYMGHIQPGHALPFLFQQLAWISALVLFGRWLLSRGTRRMVVQGG